MASIHIVHSLERAELKSDAPEAQVPQPAVSVDASIGSGGAGGDGAAEAAMPEEFREEMRVIGKLRAFISTFMGCGLAFAQHGGVSSSVAGRCCDVSRTRLTVSFAIPSGDGEMLTRALYCFRSCVPALPQVGYA